VMSREGNRRLVRRADGERPKAERQVFDVKLEPRFAPPPASSRRTANRMARRDQGKKRSRARRRSPTGGLADANDAESEGGQCSPRRDCTAHGPPVFRSLAPEAEALVPAEANAKATVRIRSGRGALALDAVSAHERGDHDTVARKAGACGDAP
jgi:hypothetical protein